MRTSTALLTDAYCMPSHHTTTGRTSHSNLVHVLFAITQFAVTQFAVLSLSCAVQVFMFLFDKSGRLLHANQRALDHYCGACQNSGGPRTSTRGVSCQDQQSVLASAVA